MKYKEGKRKKHNTKRVFVYIVLGEIIGKHAHDFSECMHSRTKTHEKNPLLKKLYQEFFVPATI